MQQFHAEMGTFHLSCREYDVLPLDWMAISGLRIEREPVLTEFLGFVEACDLLGIAYPQTMTTRYYFGPTHETEIRMRWLEVSIPWKV